MSNMDTVFAVNANDELEFDTVFDTEDSLIDTVNGVNESGDPLTGADFEDLHQTEDEATVDDVKDELGPDHDEKMGATNPEGSKEAEVLDVSVKGEVNKDSDADKLYDGAEEEYQDKKVTAAGADDSDVTKTIDNAVKEDCDGADDRDIDAELNAGDGDDNDVTDDDDDRDIDAELNEAGSIKDVDDDGTDEDVEAVANEKINKKPSSKLEYNIEDEELIDLVASGRA